MLLTMDMIILTALLVAPASAATNESSTTVTMYLPNISGVPMASSALGSIIAADANAETLALVCPNTTASGAQQRCALPTPFVITVGNSTLNYTATNGAATSTVSCEYTPESPDADRVAADCSGTVDGGAMPGSVLFAIDTVGSEVNITAGLEKLVTATGSESRQTATMASMTGTPSTSAASVHTGTSTAAAAGSTMVSGLGGFVAGVAIVVAAL